MLVLVFSVLAPQSRSNYRASICKQTKLMFKTHFTKALSLEKYANVKTTQKSEIRHKRHTQKFPLRKFLKGSSDCSLDRKIYSDQ